VPAEPGTPEGRRVCGREIAGLGKDAGVAIVALEHYPIAFRQPVEQNDANRGRKLLARERVDEALEQRRESRR